MTTEFLHGSPVGSTEGMPRNLQTYVEAMGQDYLLLGGGESVYPKESVAASTAAASQELVLAGFVAKRTEPITQVRVCTGGTAAAATPTICRFGIYSRADNGDIALLASTVNDTALFSATNTIYTKSFSSTFYKQMGVEYFVGLLIVTGVARPVFHAPATGWPAGWLSDSGSLFRPASHAKVTGQANLPSSVVNASVVSSAYTFHALLLP